MNKMKGFTLIELIFTLLLTAILASIVIEIIAGPIKAYFWASQRTLQVEVGELALETLERELKQALVNTLAVDNQPTKQTLSFNKILYTGFAAQSTVVLSTISNEIEFDKPYLLFFPKEKLQNIITAKVTNNQNRVILQADDKAPLSHQVQPFYLLSTTIHYICDKKTARLERLEGGQVALIANHVRHCDFAKQGDLVVFTLEMDAKQKEPVVMTYPYQLGSKL